LLHSNRSAAHYQLGRYEQALDDAEMTTAIAPKWPKGFARKAAACEALGNYGKALAAYQQIIKLHDVVEAPKAEKKIQQLQQKLKQQSKADGVIRNGFLHDPKTKATSSLYGEKEEIVRPVVDKATGSTRLENDDERKWRFMLKRLKDGCSKDGVNASGQKVVLDDGVFAKLLQQHEFQTLIYPGIPKDQLVHAPTNLQQLLEDPWYENELLSLMPKVQAKAQSVLANVKKKGAAQGDIMDAATEQLLMPQILQEAFGREVLAMVHRVNYKKHVLLANDARTIADPQADEATWDQLPDLFLDELFRGLAVREDDVAGTAVLDDFMGEDWRPLVLSDAQRMVKNGLLLDTAPSGGASSIAGAAAGRVRFLENADCESEFPAMAELLTKLHALPFEINAKRSNHATLCAQFAHSTAIHQLRDHEQQRLRLDCGTGDKDNGFKLTCFYFIDGTASRELRLRTSLEAGARVQRIAARPDRLVLFQSQHVFNEIVVVEPDAPPLLYVAFWIHGKALRG
jgi:hypothetical protein